MIYELAFVQLCWKSLMWYFFLFVFFCLQFVSLTDEKIWAYSVSFCKPVASIKQKKTLTSLHSSLCVLYAYLCMYICGCTCFLSAETILLVNLGFYYCLCCCVTLLCSAPCLLWSRCCFLCIIRLVIQYLIFYCKSVCL